MPAEKTQPFCPCSRVLNWTGKGLTIHIDGDGLVVSFIPQSNPRKEPLTVIELESGWFSELVWVHWRRDASLAPVGISTL